MDGLRAGWCVGYVVGRVDFSGMFCRSMVWMLVWLCALSRSMLLYIVCSLCPCAAVYITVRRCVCVWVRDIDCCVNILGLVSYKLQVCGFCTLAILITHLCNYFCALSQFTVQLTVQLTPFKFNCGVSLQWKNYCVHFVLQHADIAFIHFPVLQLCAVTVYILCCNMLTLPSLISQSCSSVLLQYTFCVATC